ncbi:hypothetical protein PARC_a2020 [Pseudoalteromonas arctica A 37-1-2]|uniref:Uncharacterized protein n=1 Tax=Pseudoalteromonas arctica A 37-1-2 TaxID=1117313 RepID=A0A290S352_9GAMM|nr:hypothetical protein PARC_a2020 [Pseudoalteromonas arctica A 37-1-2]
MQNQVLKKVWRNKKSPVKKVKRAKRVVLREVVVVFKLIFRAYI